MTAQSLQEPTRLTVDPDVGALLGGTGRYEKRLADLAGVFRDDVAYRTALATTRDPDAPVYWVEESRLAGTGELITGISVLEPGSIGDEYYMTRGHLHARPECAELYLAVAGRGVMLLDALGGETRAIEIAAGEAVQVPGHWVHRSVNVGSDRFATIFCYSADAGQDYQIIADAGGMRNLVLKDGTGGWTIRPNPDHRGYRHG